MSVRAGRTIQLNPLATVLFNVCSAVTVDAICLGVIVILLLNVMELFNVLEVLCWIDHVWSSKDCVRCACDPSVLLTSVLFMFYMSEVISSLKSLRAGSQVFALLMLFHCVIVHTMWSGKRLQWPYILPFNGMLCLSAISIMFVKIRLAVCMEVGIVV